MSIYFLADCYYYLIINGIKGLKSILIHLFPLAASDCRGVLAYIRCAESIQYAQAQWS